jgi:hypothetical protein
VQPGSCGRRTGFGVRVRHDRRRLPSWNDGRTTPHDAATRTMIDRRQGTPMTAAARQHRHRTQLSYAVAPVVLATLAACTGSDPGPVVTTPPSSSTSTGSTAPTTATSNAPRPSPTIDPVLAKIPAPARPETPDGSVAFAEFFVSQVNIGFTTANPHALDGLFSESCKACREFEKGAQELKKRGLRHNGTSLETAGANSNEYSSKVRSVAVLVTQNSVPVINEAGKSVRRTNAGSGTLLATLTFKGHWIVTNLQVAK